MTRVVHCQREPYDVYIGRPGPWGNPFRGKRSEAIRQFRQWFLYDDEAQELRDNIKSLEGKTLGCWCAPKPCHGDVLVEVINNHVLDILT